MQIGILLVDLHHNIMTKQDLVLVLVKKAGCSKKCAVDCLNVILDGITKSLVKGQSVVLTGFGTFKVLKRAARTGRNPKTGAAIKIPERKVARFKAGNELKKAVR